MSLLRQFHFDTLAQPYWLVLALGVLALFCAEVAVRAPGAMSISTGEVLLAIRGRRMAVWRRIPAALRALGLLCLLVAMAGPLNGLQVRKDRANVIDVMLCVDVSSSMETNDFVSNGQWRTRLFMTKKAVHDFVESRKEKIEDRFGYDRLGLILYAKFARTQTPLTLDYGILLHELDRAGITRNERKDGTAIGSAIGLAVRRLSQSEAKSKVIVLLTDGLNNAGELDPVTAARLAEKYGMRVYTIGAGATRRDPMNFFLGGGRSQPIDEGTLREIAEITGARYYRAADTESLKQAYAEINELEMTEIEVGDYYEYKEAFVPYVLLGALALLASLFGRRQWFEVIP